MEKGLCASNAVTNASHALSSLFFVIPDLDPGNASSVCEEKVMLLWLHEIDCLPVLPRVENIRVFGKDDQH